MQETIELIVKVKINFEDKKDRKRAILMAKECVLSSRIHGSTGCDPKSSKLVGK